MLSPLTVIGQNSARILFNEKLYSFFLRSQNWLFKKNKTRINLASCTPWPYCLVTIGHRAPSLVWEREPDSVRPASSLWRRLPGAGIYEVPQRVVLVFLEPAGPLVWRFFFHYHKEIWLLCWASASHPIYTVKSILYGSWHCALLPLCPPLSSSVHPRGETQPFLSFWQETKPETHRGLVSRWEFCLFCRDGWKCDFRCFQCSCYRCDSWSLRFCSGLEEGAELCQTVWRTL